MSKPSRLSLTIDLACACMTVLVSGHIADKTLRAAAKKNLSRRGAHPLAGVLSEYDPKDFLTGGKYHGAFFRTALTLQLHPSTVAKAAYGRSSVPHTVAAIRETIRQIDAEISFAPVPLAFDELAEFHIGGRYFGIPTRVAKRLGISRSSVLNVTRGVWPGHDVLPALRAEMAIVDAALNAGPDAPNAGPDAPLTQAEKAQFGTGGKYYGVYAEVSRYLKQNPSAVHHAASNSSPRRTLRAIRDAMATRDAEMSRVDAEIEAKNTGVA
jgi:hypothetical protein